MDPIIGASLIGGLFGAAGGRSANRARSREARLNREFQEKTLRNQHQWQVQDLKSAGLNPLLSSNSGAGSASGSMAQQENVGESAVKSASSAVSVSRTRQEIANLKLQADGQRIANAKDQFNLDILQRSTSYPDFYSSQHAGPVGKVYSTGKAVANDFRSTVNKAANVIDFRAYESGRSLSEYRMKQRFNYMKKMKKSNPSEYKRLYPAFISDFKKFQSQPRRYK